MSSKIIGTWQLVDYSRFEDNVEKKWEGTQVGTLKYFSDGRVDMNIQRTSESCGTNSLDEQRLNIWYKGKYQIIDSRHIVHEILESSLSERIGQKLEREFLLDQDRLIIEGTGLSDRVRLVWQWKS